MKLKITKLTSVIAFIFLLVAGSGHAVELKVAWENAPQPPYYMGKGTKIPALPGVAVEMVMMLEEYIDGLKVVPQRLPWKRCLKSLQLGKIDGTFNASYKKKRLEFGFYPTKDGTLNGAVDPSFRITTIQYCLYAKKDSKVSWDGKKFNNLTGAIGAPLGYSIVGDLEKLGAKVDTSPSTQNDFLKLNKNRVAAVAAQGITGDALLSSFPKKFSELHKLEPPLKTKPYYIMLSKQFVGKHPDLAKKIWATIKIIRETRLADIAKKYVK